MTKKIALDCGHGLKTAGKQTLNGANGIIKEWTLNDKVRDLVVEYLKDYDVEFVFPDNNEGQVDESLASRFNLYVNKKVDVAVSIHHNAYNGKWNKATGVEVFTDRKYTEDDERLAQAIYKNLPTYTGLRGRGIKRENWAVINQNRIPAVLVEGGFMDSTIDYPVITSTKGQEGYAKAVAEGLIEFLGLKKKVVKKKTVEELVKEVLAGKHGNGDARKKSLGDMYNVVQAKINEMYAPKPKKIEVGAIVKIKSNARYGGLASARGRLVPLAVRNKKHTIKKIQVNKGVEEALLKEINSWVALAYLTLV